MRKMYSWMFAALLMLAAGSDRAIAYGVPTFDSAIFTKTIESIGLSAKQLAELEALLDNTVKVLAQATWTHDAVTGRWDVEASLKSRLQSQYLRFISQNVPSKYRQLFSAVVTGNIAAYLRARRTDFPLIVAHELDPWNDSPLFVKHFMEAQKSYDVSHAMAQQTYDETEEAMATLVILRNQLDQPNVGASQMMTNQLLVENGMNFLNWQRANATHEARNEMSIRREIESRRRLNRFLGEPIIVAPE